MISYIVTPILYIFLVITFKYLFSLRKRLPLPPGPFSWPLIGNIFQVDRRRPHASLSKLAQAHAPDLMSIRFGTRLVVIASSPAAASEVLKTNDRMLSGRYLSPHIRVKGSRLHNLSTALLEECDDYWKSIRKIYRAELFSTKALESQLSMREKKVAEMMHHLTIKQGQSIKIRDVVSVTSFNVMGNLILSTDLIDFQGKGVGQRMRKYVTRYTKLAATPQLADLYPILGIFSGDFQGTYKKLMVLFDKICDVWTGILQDRRNRDSQLPSLGSIDFIDAMVKNGYTDTQINALLVETFGAGTESTTATSEWMLVELLRHPQALQKLRNEIAEVVGGKNNVIKEADLQNLPYLEACFKETLRLHPPGPLLLPHRAVQTCEVMGYRIPKDTQVMVNMWAIARDPKNWGDPSSFKPERFINSKMDYIGRYFEYIPFGSGRRMCAGQPLASRFVPLVVASLIHGFDWILPNDMDPAQIDMDEILDITMFKNDPLLIIPTLRKRVRVRKTK
ncbi:putative BAG family molecular chaperone regulator 1-like [Capsicum annuum]|nr:putative BAG family molecular chaperone regulator 1-like [Capsicum annuum]